MSKNADVYVVGLEIFSYLIIFSLIMTINKKAWLLCFSVIALQMLSSKIWGTIIYWNRNIMVKTKESFDNEYIIKITDFGVSKYLNIPQMTITRSFEINSTLLGPSIIIYSRNEA